MVCILWDASVGVQLLIIGMPYGAFLLLLRVMDKYLGKNSDEEGKGEPMSNKTYEHRNGVWLMIVTVVASMLEGTKEVLLNSLAGLLGGFISNGIAHWRPKAHKLFLWINLCRELTVDRLRQLLPNAWRVC